jgi:putative membrane protein
MTDPPVRPTVIELSEAVASPMATPCGPAIFETEDSRPIETGEQPGIASAMAAEPVRRNRPFKVALIGLGILVIGLLIFDAVEWVKVQFDRGPVVGGLAVTVIAAGLLGLGYWLISEFRAFAALKSVERVQARLTMSSGQDARSGNALIDDIVSSLPSAPTVRATLAVYREQVQSHHTWEQRVGLISRTVLVPIDHRAEALIRATVMQTVVFTAISPTALMESLFFLARGLRLLRQIAELYGGRPGFAGTVHLMRRLIVGSGTVGAVDLIGNVLAQKLGGAILEKLSSEVAESVYATQQMARLGIVCMQMCRPIPFTRDENPSVSGLIAGALKRQP